MSDDADVEVLRWLDGAEAGDLREWGQNKLLECAAKCAIAASSGTASNTYFNGMKQVCAAIKDALLVYDKRHARDEIEAELQEYRDLRDELQRATKEARESGGAYLGAPPSASGATNTH